MRLTMQGLTNDQLLVPQIHLNGNTADSLIEELAEAQEALTEVLRILGRMELAHGRNWYHTGNTPEAREQHLERIIVVERVQEELKTIMHAIMDQRDQREGR